MASYHGNAQLSNSLEVKWLNCSPRENDPMSKELARDSVEKAPLSSSSVFFLCFPVPPRWRYTSGDIQSSQKKGLEKNWKGQGRIMQCPVALDTVGERTDSEINDIL